MKRNTSAAVLLSVAMMFLAEAADAACMNKYVARAEGNKKILTLLTGKLTFAEAQEMAKAISAKSHPPVEWVDAEGKSIAQSSVVEAVRPMPVACDDKPSGSVINVTFLTFATPGKGLMIKFSEDLIVYFDEQGK